MNPLNMAEQMKQAPEEDTHHSSQAMAGMHMHMQEDIRMRHIEAMSGGLSQRRRPPVQSLTTGPWKVSTSTLCYILKWFLDSKPAVWTGNAIARSC